MGGKTILNSLRLRWFAFLAASIVAASAWNGASAEKFRTPNFHTSDRCVACHNGLTTRAGEDISIGLAWNPTMMANSARDPYWHAAVRREALDHPEAQAEIEDECSICHMPMARFESRAGGHEGKIFAHLGFLPDDDGDRLAADGVSCSLCHQIGKEKLGARESFVGSFVIGGPTLQGERVEFGPYAPGAGHTRIMRSSTGGFVPSQSAHLGESEMCATCHTLLTRPLGEAAQGTGEFPEQVPYLEWKHSVYVRQRGCQSCHMPAVPEEVAVTSLLGVPRAEVSRHTFVGGNFLMKGILNRNRTELKVASPPAELDASAEKTRLHLQSESARMSIGAVEVRDGRLLADLTVTNLAGHKLPTAYPSRRVWVHLAVRDKDNAVLFESGAVTPEGLIAGNDNDLDAARYERHHTEIREKDEVQIYEAIMADGRGAVTTGLLHAVRYLKDNRILPHGFDKTTAGRDIAVAGAALEDPDFTGGSDRIRYSIDIGNAQGPFRVEASLCYQPVAYRWAMNLRPYRAAEPERFVRYYAAAASASTVVLTRATARSR